MKISDFNLIFLLASNIMVILVAVWKASQWEERLQSQITQNHKDINGGLESVRQEIRQRDKFWAIKVNTLIKYLEKTTDYQPPTMDDFDGDKR